MEIITMESAAYKELVAKIDKVAEYIRQNEQQKRSKKTDIWLSSKELITLLNISPRTLQRLRDNKRINYAIFGGDCRYHISEVEQFISDSIYSCDPQSLEEFKRNYLLRTGGRKR